LVSWDAARVRAPTLVLHAESDALIPFSEARAIAASIPGARLVPLKSKNHVILEHEPAWSQFLEEVSEFINGPRAARAD
jgi:pimeloyl-ACP methyl ester carboxylesterase